MLPPVLRVGVDAAIRAELIGIFERMMDPQKDLGLLLTTVAATCLSSLVTVAPGSPHRQTG